MSRVIFNSAPVREGGYIFSRKRWFEGGKTGFSEKKYVGGFRLIKKTGAPKRLTGWKNSISSGWACHAERRGILKRPQKKHFKQTDFIWEKLHILIGGST